MEIRKDLSRRRLLRILGGGTAAGITIVLAACNGDEAAPAVPATPAPAAKAEPAAPATPKAEPEEEPMVEEPEAEPKEEPMVEEPEAEMEAEPKAEAKAEPKEEPMVEEPMMGASGPRGDVPRNRTVIAENLSGRNPNPEVFNPYSNSNQNHGGQHQLALESAMYINLQSGKEEPWQLDGFEYDAGFNGVTMSVRDGIEWSDGMPFTANDIAFTLNMLREGTADMRWVVDVQEWVAAATADGDKRVHIEFNKPNPRYMSQFFATLYWSLYFVPQHIWEGVDPATFTNFDLDQGWPIFTGPYTLTASTELETVWDRNDNWWGAKAAPAIGGVDRQTPLRLPTPERVIFVGVENAEKRAAKAIANEQDTFWHMPRSVYEKVNSENPNVRAWFPDLPYAYFDPAPRHLAFNLKAPPFDNRDVRWGISYAIDRDKVVEFAYEGITTVTDVFFPLTPAMGAFRDSAIDLFETYPASEFNLAKSAERMEDAGYTLGDDDLWVDADGNTVEVVIEVSNSAEDMKRYAPIVADQLRVAGFDSTFKISESGAFSDGISRGDVLTYTGLVGGTTVNVSDPWGTFRLFHSSHSAPIGEIATGQRTRFENAEFDAIVDQMSEITTTDPRMKDLFRDSMEIILRESIIIPIVQTALLTPNNYTYWTNWPDIENDYHAPSQWWGSFIHSILTIEPTQ